MFLEKRPDLDRKIEGLSNAVNLPCLDRKIKGLSISRNVSQGSGDGALWIIGLAFFQRSVMSVNPEGVLVWGMTLKEFERGRCERGRWEM